MTSGRRVSRLARFADGVKPSREVAKKRRAAKKKVTAKRKAVKAAATSKRKAAKSNGKRKKG